MLRSLVNANVSCRLCTVFVVRDMKVDYLTAKTVQNKLFAAHISLV